MNPTQDADLRSVPTITYAAASRVVARAVAHAQGLGVPVNIAVADPAGHVIAFARMDGAALLSSSVAVDKAYSVSAFNGMPTHAWYDAIKDEPALLHGLVHRPRLTIFAGGIPLRTSPDGQMVGSIGVSGGSAEQDREIAEAGAAAF